MGLTESLTSDACAAALRVRALANLGDVERAAAVASVAVARNPLTIELRYLHAMLLMNLERYDDAEHALRRVLYLDRSLEVAHFALGTTLHRRGDLAAAARAYRNSRDLAARRPPAALLPLSDGEQAGCLARAATAQAALLEPVAERGA